MKTLALLLAIVSPAAFAAEFTVEVPAFAKIEAKQVYQGFGCTGSNVSPAVTWSNPPAGTKSYALTVYDPDAPTGSGWWHWVVYNLPASTTSLAEGVGTAKSKKLPKGAAQGRTDFGTVGYGGPCPPPGDKPHRYILTVHALKADKLEVPKDATAAMIGFSIHQNSIGKATVTGTYGR